MAYSWKCFKSLHLDENKIVDKTYERVTITECGTVNRSLRVENYKEYLFDFESELTVDYASLQELRRLKNRAKHRL